MLASFIVEEPDTINVRHSCLVASPLPFHPQRQSHRSRRLVCPLRAILKSCVCMFVAKDGLACHASGRPRDVSCCLSAGELRKSILSEYILSGLIFTNIKEKKLDRWSQRGLIVPRSALEILLGLMFEHRTISHMKQGEEQRNDLKKEDIRSMGTVERL
jgi:hypothetical protein